MAKLLGRTGPAAGQDFIVAESASLGASAENDVRIPAPGVSRRHARVFREGTQFFLEDTGATNGTFLNGGRIQRETLRHLDVITLGKAVDLIFIARENEPIVAAPDRVLDVKLEFMDGPEAGTAIDVPKGEITFGRAPGCNVVLASQAVSKVHGRIQRTGSQIVLQDLQSANSTFVNGRRVESVVPLANGDVISFAGVRGFTVRIKGEGDKSAGAEGAQALAQPTFDQEWKTRFVWVPEELAEIEKARAEAIALAALRAPSPAAAAKKAAPPPAAAKAAPAAAVKPPVAAAPPKPAAAAAAPKPPEAAAAKPAPVVAPPAPAPAAAPPAPAQAAAPPAPAPAAAPTPVVAPAPPPAPKPAAAPAPAPAAPKPAPVPPAEGVTMPSRDAASLRGPRITGIRLMGATGPISLGLGTFLVGRGATANVRLEDPQASRSHASIVVAETGVTVEDLKTVNGTALNGVDAKAPVVVKNGDVVRFGGTDFKIEVISAP
jgi:pSer/pThr/pTyr-binding forkhead associated (FHA) protein